MAFVSSSKFYRERATQMRELAALIPFADIRAEVEGMARRFDDLAEQAAQSVRVRPRADEITEQIKGALGAQPT